jgi:uncharacterized membrane protein YhaH (DUF805 family)
MSDEEIKPGAPIAPPANPALNHPLFLRLWGLAVALLGLGAGAGIWVYVVRRAARGVPELVIPRKAFGASVAMGLVGILLAAFGPGAMNRLRRLKDRSSPGPVEILMIGAIVAAAIAATKMLQSAVAAYGYRF